MTRTQVHLEKTLDLSPSTYRETYQASTNSGGGTVEGIENDEDDVLELEASTSSIGSVDKIEKNEIDVSELDDAEVDSYLEDRLSGLLQSACTCTYFF